MYNLENYINEIDNKRIINVLLENGVILNKTYLKRAKGLVKNNRAKWINDTTIELLESYYLKSSIKQQAMFWYKNLNNNCSKNYI